MKTYTTHVTKYDRIRGEYEAETQTPEKLYSFDLYERTETRQTPLILFAIGGNIENAFCSNWDIYADGTGHLYSIARKESGACGTHYGDKNHVKNLIRQGFFRDTLTEYGQAIMNA